MRLTVTTRSTKPKRQLPRLRGRPDSFTLRQLDEAMKRLRESERERKPTHATTRAR